MHIIGPVSEQNESVIMHRTKTKLRQDSPIRLTDNNSQLVTAQYKVLCSYFVAWVNMLRAPHDGSSSCFNPEDEETFRVFSFEHLPSGKLCRALVFPLAPGGFASVAAANACYAALLDARAALQFAISLSWEGSTDYDFHTDISYDDPGDNWPAAIVRPSENASLQNLNNWLQSLPIALRQKIQARRVLRLSQLTTARDVKMPQVASYMAFKNQLWNDVPKRHLR